MTITKKLPPDPEEINESRAEWAEQAIRAFQDATQTDDGDALSDLLCDLMHWSDRNGKESFATQLRRAEMHYEEETSGEGEDDDR